MVEVEAKTKQKSGNCPKQYPWLWFGVILVLTFCTRFYKVTEPDHVCWDETHFGKMGSWYINRTFFFDVHPPLGKMLIALSGVLSGYNGTYPFEKPGDKYNGTQYEGMRIFCTTLGALIVPMTFSTIWELTESNDAALIAAAYLLFDVGMLTLNQYILLDPILLCFMTASVLGMVKLSKTTNVGQTFTRKWWYWLFFTGTMLACTMSVKFVGLFVVLLVGLHTINDLWIVLGDLTKPVIYTIKQLIAKTVGLIIWPAFLYMFFFYIHLTVLNRSGNGDGFYSSAFQSCLIGNSLHNASMPRQVAYGAIVTIKNHKTGGGYLHSHYHLYPKEVGARQQQITTYTHKDENNKWLIKPYNKEPSNDVRVLKNGDLVRLEHTQTKRNLHAHREPAPLTKKHFQVTGYGENGTGDANDIWKAMIVSGKDNEEALTVTSKLYFVHYLQNCVLTTSGKQLPKWGFEQQEVSCNPNIRDPNAVWNVEDNVYEKLPNVSFQVYAPGFLSRFLESHAVMFQGNAGLKPKEGEVTSRPWQWPINYKGQFFSGSSYRIYLLGNPIIWWSNLVFLGLFLIVFLISLIRVQRHYETKENDEKWRSLLASLWLFGGWILHYLPFWAMGRVLYFHHYFPALIFNSMLTGTMDESFNYLMLMCEYVRLFYSPCFFCLLTHIGFHVENACLNQKKQGVMFSYFSHRFSPWIRHALLGATLAILAYSFIVFSPMAYGMTGSTGSEPNSTMYSLKWMDSWEF